MNTKQSTKPKTHKPGSGGVRAGAGPKIGSQNALKPENKRRSVKKMITFTPDEWPVVQAGMNKTKQLEFNNFARDKILKDL